MALPFIVGPHQCSLTHGPDGRPQVEVVLRIRLPLAEFFDALLLSLAEQRPLFQQSGYGTAQASPAPGKAGLQTGGHIGPMPKEETPPYWKAASRAQPKRSPPGAPLHPPKHAPKVDPTHEKLLAVLSQSTSIPDTAAVGAATTRKDVPTPSINEGRMLSTTEPGEGQPNCQAACSRDPEQQYPPPGRTQRRIGEDGTSEHLPPQRAFAHPKKCPVQ